jgi:hypothetical protein
MKSLKLLTLHCSNIRWSIWVQVEGVLATMVYSGMTFIILKVIDLVIGIRVMLMMNVWVLTLANMANVSNNYYSKILVLKNSRIRLFFYLSVLVQQVQKFCYT